MDTSDVTVVIAHRDMGVDERRRSFAYVTNHYLSLGLVISIECGRSDATFTRASAINAAIRGTPGRIIVQTDPDCLVLESQLDAAISLARRHDGLVLPHDRYLHLTADATGEVYAGRPVSDVGPGDSEHHGLMGCGGVTVFSRATWETARGFDERFGLWGGDDAAFIYACSAMVADTRRVAGDMVHLWHPKLPQSQPGTAGYTEQFTILAEYRDAAAEGPEAVRALVEAR